MQPFFKQALWLLLLTGLTVTAQAFDKDIREFTKVIKREFPISANGTVNLSNKYGKIDVKNWNNDRVKIGVTVVVEARNESAAQRVFDRVDIGFSNSKDYVSATTDLNMGSNWGNNIEFSINYEVYMPASNNLNLSHKYGDVYIADINGQVKMEVKYANFKVNKVGPESVVDLGYGNGIIALAQDLAVDVKNSQFTLEEGRDLNIESKYTQVMLDEVRDVTADSKYDNYQIGTMRDFRNSGAYDNFKIQEAANVSINSKYTNIDIGEVGENLDVDLSYGHLESSLDRSFQAIEVISRYTDIRFAVDRQADYRLEAAARYAGIKYPASLEVEYEKKTSTSHEIKGYKGNDNTDNTIRVSLSYGGCKIYED